MGNGQFASVSSVTGLDFDDDSRAIAICDWDFDGRLDFWMTGRTAPRLRLVHNREKRSGGFVALKLQGSGIGTNRDAIGARVEIVLRNGKQPTRLIKTLHAGDAFLSQSSGWLHFGLGAATEIDKVIVRWPSRDIVQRTQTIKDVTANRFHLIRQGTDTAEVWQPPRSRVVLDPNSQIPTPTADPIRIVLPSRLPLPEIRAIAESGEQESLPLNGPVLVNIWSATCPVCVQELGEWSSHAEEFQRRGLAIMAVNADVGNEELRPGSVIDQLATPLPWCTATPESIQAVDYFQRAMLDRWQPLPVPTSFLLDQDGQAVVIYKGAVSAQQLWEDLSLLELDPERVRDVATPFAGQWLRSVPGGEPTAVSKQMIDHRSVNMAIAYLGRFIETHKGASPGRLADTYYVRGLLLESQKRFPEAVSSLQQAAKLKPNDLRAHSDLARLLDQFGKLPEAQKEWLAAYKINPENYEVQHGLAANLLRQRKFKASAQLLERVLAQRPDDAVAHFRIATAYRNLKKWRAAKASYSRALEEQPNMILAANNLAWMLATHPDPSLRNGARSVSLAEQACKATQYKEPHFLDTLSVAYAENGEFERAAETARKAVGIMKSNERISPESIRPLVARIKEFEANKPYRETTD